MSRPKRVWLVVAALAVSFAGAFVFLMPWSCDDSEGPSWERCRTVMGTPAFSVVDWGLSDQLDFLIPFVIALVVGMLTWGILRTINRS